MPQIPELSPNIYDLIPLLVFFLAIFQACSVSAYFVLDIQTKNDKVIIAKSKWVANVKWWYEVETEENGLICIQSDYNDEAKNIHTRTQKMEPLERKRTKRRNRKKLIVYSIAQEDYISDVFALGFFSLHIYIILHRERWI